jgi:hypothetical protein
VCREKAEATFLSPEFQENIERYFVDNIKVRGGVHMFAHAW